MEVKNEEKLPEITLQSVIYRYYQSSLIYHLLTTTFLKCN